MSPIGDERRIGRESYQCVYVAGSASEISEAYESVVVSLAANTANQVIIAAPSAGRSIWVYGLFLAVGDGAGSVLFRESGGVALTGSMAFPDGGRLCIGPSGNFAMPIWKLPAARALWATTTGAATFNGWLCYAIVGV